MNFQPIVHYSLHLVFPFLIAWFFFRSNWKVAGLIILLTILVDIDHIFATPIFDPSRCSIGFHPLHSFWAIGIYIIAVFFKEVRLVAIGLLFHMFTDLIDCIYTFNRCHDCFINSKIYTFLNSF